MTYDISIEMTTHISEVTAKAIVAKAIEEHTGKNISEVKEIFVDGRFNGFDIKFEPDTSFAPAAKNSWRPTIWR